MFGCEGGRNCGVGALGIGGHSGVIAEPVDVPSLSEKDRKYYEAFQQFDLDKSGFGMSAS